MKNIVHVSALVLTLTASISAFAEPTRGLKIVCSESAPAAVKEQAERLLTAKDHASLEILSDGSPPSSVTSTEELAQAPAEDRAFDNLILVGMPDDPLIAKAWAQEADISGGEAYVFGFGHLKGDIGYVESNRNPFLHGRAIDQTPYETQTIILTGTSPTGVGLAVDAFLQGQVTNGPIAGPGWERGETTILDRDPLTPDRLVEPLVPLPKEIGDWKMLGMSQCSEDQYRGVLSNTDNMPEQMWRVKYYRPGEWDGVGLVHAFDHYSDGLHNRAYGNSVLMVKFASEDEAAAALKRMRGPAGCRKQVGQFWVGDQRPYFNARRVGESEVPGPFAMWTEGPWVLFSSLPQEANETIAAASTAN
ncbi:MAG: hypothetical protein WA771_16015 [Chthoniobacterales bacterium]